MMFILYFLPDFHNFDVLHFIRSDLKFTTPLAEYIIALVRDSVAKSSAMN